MSSHCGSWRSLISIANRVERQIEEDFGWGSVAEAAARAVVHEVFGAAQFGMGDGAEVGPFGEELS